MVGKPVQLPVGDSAGGRSESRVEVAEVLHDRNRVRLVTGGTNQHGEPVLVGEAWVMPPPTAIQYDDVDHQDGLALAA